MSSRDLASIHIGPCRLSVAGRGSKAGFTLMEMLVVLLLLGALFTLAIPSMRTALLDDELLKSSRRLVGALREARERAVGEHKPYLLHFDLGQNTFSYELEGSTTPADERKKPLQLTGSVRIVDVQTPSQEKKSSGVVTLWVSERGFMEPALVHLRDEEGGIKTLVLSPFSPAVKVMDNYVEADFDE